MEYLLAIIAAPIAVWALDRAFYRGELAEAVLEAINSTKAPRQKADKARRSSSTNRMG